MRIGDTFETADCKNCGSKIKHEYWGNGGNTWVHENGRWDCFTPKYAYPVEGTITPFVKE